MKEIGGYFGLESFGGRELYADLLPLNSARNALLYLLKARDIKKLYIPYYLCDCVSDICDKYGYAYEYYPIGKNFLPQVERSFSAGEYLYTVNFFGQISNDMILAMQEKYGNIIFDNVQAFFQPPVHGVDTIYSCRKFFGVPDGGYLSTDIILTEHLPQDSSRERMTHILGRFEQTASEHYASYQANEAVIDELPLAYMSPITKNILCAVDYSSVRAARNANYKTLAAALDRINPLRIKQPEGAYVYPFYAEKGMEIKRALAAEKIFVPTLWPNVLECEAEFERGLAENILPLPCDQRYDGEDMQRILDELLPLIG